MTLFLAQSFTGQVKSCALGKQIYAQKLSFAQFQVPAIEPFFGTGEDPGFNAQVCTNKALTIDPLGNTCEADEVSPKVEVGVVAILRCLQPYLRHIYVII
jgi:hypothetical protein